MNNLQAKQMLKQVDCQGIPRGYNGDYIELYKYCLKSIEKLEQIGQIAKRDYCFSDEYHRAIKDIRNVLEQE